MVFEGLWGWLRSLLHGKPKGQQKTGEHPRISSRPRTRNVDVARQPDSLPSEATRAREPRPLAGTSRRASQDGQQAVPEESAAPSAKQRPPLPKTIDLIIGLDFGTAATKVVVRSPWLPGHRARAVSFEELGHPTSPYLLPSRLRFADDGRICLNSNVPGVSMTNLKIALLDHAESNARAVRNAEPLGTAAAYLALVLREARQRFLRAEQEIYRRFEIRWAVNMGIPSRGYDDKSVCEEFLRAARVAWQLSWKSGPITSNHVADVLRQEKDGAGNADIPISVVPEVVAQAVGYARSPLRDAGLHLLMDVGASTLDVCGFVLRAAEGQDCYDLLTATVHRLGVLELHRQRLAAVLCERGKDRPEEFDPLAPLPEKLSDYHPGCPCGATDVDAQYREKLVRVLTRHLATLKKRRDPYSERWKTGLPVFLCGGGGVMRFFREAASQADNEFRKVMIAEPVRLRTLPKPEGLVNRDIDAGLFHRLSVAYGLSFDTFNIGSVTPPKEMEDIKVELRKRDYEKAYVSKDQV
jgi:hypothetical protein